MCSSDLFPSHDMDCIRVKSGRTSVTQVLKVVPNPALPPDTPEYDAIIHTNSGEAAISLNGR